MRKCKKCNKPGHNSRTCGTTKENIISSAPRTLAEKGRQILAEQENEKIDREEIYNTIPKKGLWIINPERQKVYGKIMQVKGTGNVLWESTSGAFVESEPNTLLSENYQFVELEPKMLTWKNITVGPLKNT